MPDITNTPAKSSSKNSTMMPVVVLVSICIVAGILLGFVYSMTAPVAAQAAYERQQETFRTLVPDAQQFEELTCTTPGCTTAVRALDAQGEAAGVVIIAQAKGYSGAVPIAVAFDTQGNALQVQVMKNEETPGLGTRVTEDDFIGQFVNRSAQTVQRNEIDTISGATISSVAVLDAFNTAVEAYGEVA